MSTEDFQSRLLGGSIAFIVIGIVMVVLSQDAKADPVRFGHEDPVTVASYTVKDTDGNEVEFLPLDTQPPYSVEFPLTWPTTTIVTATGHNGLESLPSGTVFRIPAAPTCASVDFNHDGVIGGPDFGRLLGHVAIWKFGTLLRCFGKTYSE